MSGTAVVQEGRFDDVLSGDGGELHGYFVLDSEAGMACYEQ